MSTCHRLDLQALRLQPVMSKKLPDHLSYTQWGSKPGNPKNGKAWVNPVHRERTTPIRLPSNPGRLYASTKNLESPPQEKSSKTMFHLHFHPPFQKFLIGIETLFLVSHWGIWVLNGCFSNNPTSRRIWDARLQQDGSQILIEAITTFFIICGVRISILSIVKVKILMLPNYVDYWT
jgi:hypothetical protein